MLSSSAAAFCARSLPKQTRVMAFADPSALLALLPCPCPVAFTEGSLYLNRSCWIELARTMYVHVFLLSAVYCMCMPAHPKASMPKNPALKCTELYSVYTHTV